METSNEFAISRYVGEFEQDKFSGKGKITYKNGSIFEGTFKEGKKNGFGRYVGHEGT